MPHVFGIRREDLSKTGEKRVAITPAKVPLLQQSGISLLVQPCCYPGHPEAKRAFPDEAYLAQGARLTEDLSPADVILGLKEVAIPELIPGKTYLFFSHTHKGQPKNRPLLRAMVERNITLIDYELLTDEQGRRLVTAFTYFAGYAGMTDSLWTLGRRWKDKGIASAFDAIPQAIEWEDLPRVRRAVEAAGEQIRLHGTPASQPPVIIAVLGTGKTSTGAQSILAHLPVEYIRPDQLEHTVDHGDRHKVYVLLLDIPQMFRLRPDSPYRATNPDNAALYRLYLSEPDHFESNLDKVFPYVTVLMNCILWSPKYPRLLTRQDTAAWWAQHKTLEVIGDISCDPDGAIQFSQETWITDPVFIYDPATDTSTLGFAGDGIAVMAVTNLPCEFSSDASELFSEELLEHLLALGHADLTASSPRAAGFPPALARATLLWKGEFTEAFGYMREFL